MASKLGSVLFRRYSAGASADAHGSKGSKVWKIMTFVVAIPAVAVCWFNAFMSEEEHHLERPDFVPYEHLRIRTRPFPWGDGNHTLFHNRHLNALPEGYEE